MEPGSYAARSSRMRSLTAVKRDTSPYERAIIIAPSSAPIRVCAAWCALPANRSVFSFFHSASTFTSHRSFSSKKWRMGSRMGLGSVPHSAASMPQRHMRSPRNTPS